MTNKQRRRWMEFVRRHYTTTPTSIINRLMGTESWPDPITLAAGSTIGGTAVGANAPVVCNTASLTLTAALHAGKIVNLVGATAIAGVAITPPAATGTGNRYRIFFGQSITSNTTTIDAKAGNASDVFAGFVYQFLSGTGLTVYGTSSNSNLLTFNGGTTGGLKGDLIEMVDMATNLWSLLIFQNATGSVATPLSNH